MCAQQQRLAGRAFGLRDESRRLAARIMATPAEDVGRVGRLARAGRLVGEAAQALSDATAILEEIAHGPE